MLLWQFYSFNTGMTQKARANTQQHFFFNAAPPTTAKPVVVPHKGAFVEQTAFTFDPDTPPGSVTCHVTLKNTGDAMATEVQVNVRPWHGARYSNVDEGPSGVAVKPGDYRDQVGQWVEFPDLAPGQSSTQDASFLSQANINPGINADPNIVFETAKSTPTAASH